MSARSSGPEFTVPDDPRVTRVGRVLRAAHLDELPQFGNVLRGEMSLVGPRPETPGLARQYPPELREVFAYRPGMTGPCQVFMGRAWPPPDADPERFYISHLVPRRVALDMEFLQQPTVRGDDRAVDRHAGGDARTSQGRRRPPIGYRVARRTPLRRRGRRGCPRTPLARAGHARIAGVDTRATRCS